MENNNTDNNEAIGEKIFEWAMYLVGVGTILIGAAIISKPFIDLGKWAKGLYTTGVQSLSTWRANRAARKAAKIAAKQTAAA